jgi:hypothetical protein
MEHAINIVVMALVPLGIWVAMGEGMVLEWWSKWWTRTKYVKGMKDKRGRFLAKSKCMVQVMPQRLQKPFATCTRCMVTGWGVPAVLLLNAGDVSILALLAYIPAAVGLQELIDR